MRRASIAVLLVAATLAAAGCGSSSTAINHGPPVGPVPPVRADLRITKNVPCLNGHQTLSGPDKVRDFRAVTAVVCTEETKVYPGRGQWEVYVRKVAVSSVANLQRYFEQHSVTTPPKGACLTNMDIALVPAFVDSRGRWLVPQTPRDACGHLLGFAGPGSLRVRWRVVTVRKVKLLVSAPALAAGCDMKWGRSSPVQLPAGPVFAVQPRTVHVCVYRTSQRHQWDGNFVRGIRLDSSQTQRLLSSLNGGAPHARCPRQSSFAEVIAAPGRVVTVELGGCYRVDGTRTANAAVVRSILGPGSSAGNR